MGKFSDKNGIQYLWQKIKGAFAPISHTHTKSQITDFGSYVPQDKIGQANGVAPLDENVKVPAAYLPSFVDDVVELLAANGDTPTSCAAGDMYYKSGYIYTATATDTWGSTGATPEKSKIYVDLSTEKTYRWSGSTMVEISPGVVVGTSAGTAYDGAAGAAIAASYLKGASKGNDKLTLTKQDNSTLEVGKSDLGLSDVTNDKQVKGLSSGTTNGHVVLFGADGYTVSDSGFTIGASVPANANFAGTTDSALTTQEIDEAIAAAELAAQSA